MTAQRLRLFLVVGFVVLLVGCGFGVWWLQGLLAQKAGEADHARIDAAVAEQKLEELKRLQGLLEKQKDVVARADQIAATAQAYQYQDQVIQDINVYAARHGITVSTYDFSSAAPSGSKAPDGTTLTPFSVTLKGSIPFVTFMAFLSDLENNLTKIQVSSLNLAPNAKNPQLIDNPTLSSAVYLKK